MDVVIGRAFLAESNLYGTLIWHGVRFGRTEWDFAILVQLSLVNLTWHINSNLVTEKKLSFTSLYKDWNYFWIKSLQDSKAEEIKNNEKLYILRRMGGYEKIVVCFGFPIFFCSRLLKNRKNQKKEIFDIFLPLFYAKVSQRIQFL